MTVNITNWRADQADLDMLSGYFGWRDPSYDDLRVEQWDREDRLDDFTPQTKEGSWVGRSNDRGGGLMTPRREPAPAHPSGPVPVHHRSAGSPAPLLLGGRQPSETFGAGGLT